MSIAQTTCQSGATPTANPIPPAPTASTASSPTQSVQAINTPASQAQREAVERGRGLYVSQGCYVCHGEQGEGNIGPTLASTSLTLAEVRRQIRNPRGFMPAYVEEILSDEQIRDLYAFERNLPKP